MRFGRKKNEKEMKKTNLYFFSINQGMLEISIQSLNMESPK